jgi:hypothetical protein
MWGWIYPLLMAILDFVDKKSGKPNTIQDANTPTFIRSRWTDYIRNRMRDRPSGGDRQPK